MKKIYISPAVQVLNISADTSLLAGSEIAVGQQSWQEDDELLSRRHRSSSVWDDEGEDEDEEY